MMSDEFFNITVDFEGYIMIEIDNKNDKLYGNYFIEMKMVYLPAVEVETYFFKYFVQSKETDSNSLQNLATNNLQELCYWQKAPQQKVNSRFNLLTVVLLQTFLNYSIHFSSKDILFMNRISYQVLLPVMIKEFIAPIILIIRTIPSQFLYDQSKHNAETDVDIGNCILNYSYEYCQNERKFFYPPTIQNNAFCEEIGPLVVQSQPFNVDNKGGIVLNDTTRILKTYSCDYDAMNVYYYKVYHAHYPKQISIWTVSLIGYPEYSSSQQITFYLKKTGFPVNRDIVLYLSWEKYPTNLVKVKVNVQQDKNQLSNDTENLSEEGQQREIASLGFDVSLYINQKAGVQNNGKGFQILYNNATISEITQQGLIKIKFSDSLKFTDQKFYSIIESKALKVKYYPNQNNQYYNPSLFNWKLILIEEKIIYIQCYFNNTRYISYDVSTIGIFLKY
ncbi:UNKNOWN [Stylonychia lemnae]|uniref:Uncharacterized protein n=1 Tax=Stylonychia lemnae TaxID=5949 RepID=A0A077ZW98_STYLE|nr:UNKNOWN [Stylonychia lemnae]|eukprot:CDW73861.1 UNKNOWN [Stylonychia lemnae]